MPEPSNRSFLRTVSHELRTPLNSIIGFSEILASELYGPLGSAHYREYADIIRASGEKLLKLVNQVVEIARLQTGEIELQIQPVSLAPVFDTLGEGLSEMLAARGLRLVTVPCGEAAVLADSRALRSVLTQLVQNAVTFSPDGGTITVSVRSDAGGAEIIVANEGEGFDSAELPRLLQPFEQGGNAQTHHGDGAGLGLAICNLACQAMGGRLQLVSAPGEGFAAHVRLPTA